MLIVMEKCVPELIVHIYLKFYRNREFTQYVSFQTVFTNDYYNGSNVSSYSLDKLLENLQGNPSGRMAL